MYQFPLISFSGTMKLAASKIVCLESETSQEKLFNFYKFDRAINNTASPEH